MAICPPTLHRKQSTAKLMPTVIEATDAAGIYVRLGQMDKAQAHAGKVLELEPGFAMSIFAETMPFEDRRVLEYYLDGLREAGLPE